MNNNIGIIDSGIGGLTVLDSLLKELPWANYIYVGDNKNCPYGDKNKEELLAYTTEIIDYLYSREVRNIVVACNTTNANVLDTLINKYPNIKFFGIIDSTVNSINNNLKNILVIATKKTIESHIYLNKIKYSNKDINVIEEPTPLLVPLIEENNKEYLNQVLHNYLDKYKNKIDSIILGCTHYPIVKEQIKAILGDAQIISSSDYVAALVKEYIKNYNQEGSVDIYTTGDPIKFMKSSEGFFDYNNIKVKKLNI